MRRYFFVIAALAFIGCDQSQVTDDVSATRTEEVELARYKQSAQAKVSRNRGLSLVESSKQ